MTYLETVNWMFSQLPMYQRQGKTAFKKDLTNSIAFSEKLHNPHFKFKSIHVGGTNGKGSTSHMIASILQEAGYKVGLYTSPHLKNYTERIRINGEEMSKQYVVDFIAEQKSFLEQQKLSFFEMTVGMAFHYFAEEQVDIAVIEVGLGGRLDSTNIITPEISVITNIGLDHTQFLGETLPEIAYEKAGIIKPSIPVVIGERQKEVEKVFTEKSSQTNSEILFASDSYEDYKTDLLGSYQKKNANTAVKAVSCLNDFQVDEESISKGLKNVVKNTSLKGRWQVLNTSPKVVCDTAHNKEGLSYVMSQLNNEKYDQLHVVLGVVNDKKLDQVLNLFPKNAKYYFCRPNIPRGLDAQELERNSKEYDLMGEVFNSVSEAYGEALSRSSNSDLVFVGGSTFVVAEVI
ncbi:bifunctional folylpolyglutamate synthase/dihydrofolate synthase [Pseudotenacibaculum haliotis]|uniref:Dihydrofolate synthase/folylpolyglutamate synthase n=1 Tax=Pseudotenacibaculum haliotis TaxID=1862138 RepID=A0ABW5LVV5_9FLAO